MHFALLNNNRVEAQPQLQGLCSCCSQPVIAKCGKQKIWHWAHKSKTACDNWWESETEWHRNWKNNYPADWQEISLFDEKIDEKHIADVRTPYNLVIEFQHSHIDTQERISREQFYKNMVWVVDGTRLQRDYPRFRKGTEKFNRTNRKGVYFVDSPNEIFPVNWLESSVPVVFDFRGLALPNEPQDVIKNILWCLSPKRVNNNVVVFGISREDFIKITHRQAQLHME